uniref:Uncharacterized protein n=1 Tax=Glossina brevipalpis TaxID=37001 RepID=A0A1A9W004_9MUSC
MTENDVSQIDALIGNQLKRNRTQLNILQITKTVPIKLLVVLTSLPDVIIPKKYEFSEILRYKSVAYLPWPYISSRNFKTIIPSACISTLMFGTGANAMTMCFALVPSTAISASIFKIKSTAAYMRSLTPSCHITTNMGIRGSFTGTYRTVLLKLLLLLLLSLMLHGLGSFILVGLYKIIIVFNSLEKQKNKRVSGQQSSSIRIL